MVKFHKFLHLRCHPGRVWSSESIAATHMADLDSANSPAHQAARDSHNGLHHRKAALESAKSPTARALGPAATLLFHFSSSESHRFDSVRRSRPICQTNDYISATISFLQKYSFICKWTPLHTVESNIFTHKML